MLSLQGIAMCLGDHLAAQKETVHLAAQKETVPEAKVGGPRQSFWECC